MTSLRDHWVDAAASVTLQHPQPGCFGKVTFSLETEPVARLDSIGVRDTVDRELVKDRLTINCTRITYWPGRTLARAWLVATWACYVQHEVLELAIDRETGQRVLDPHEFVRPDAIRGVLADDPRRWFDRGLQQGCPEYLTPETLRETLAIVMPEYGITELFARAAEAHFRGEP